MKEQSNKPKGSKESASGKEVKSRKGIGGPKPKPEEKKAKYAVGSFYLTQAEKQLYDKLFEQSGMISQTTFFKNIVFGGLLKLYYYDVNTPIIYEKLEEIQSEITAIGRNYNQVTKKVNGMESDKGIFSGLQELIKLTGEVNGNMKKVKEMVEEYIAYTKAKQKELSEKALTEDGTKGIQEKRS